MLALVGLVGWLRVFLFGCWWVCKMEGSGLGGLGPFEDVHVIANLYN